MTDHHAGLAVEARQATDDGLVIRKVAVAVHFDKVGKALAHIVERIGTLGMAGDLGDLPGVRSL
jgi:hypothetical protein